MEIGFDPVIFTQRTYLRTSLTIHSIFYHFLILNQPTNSKYTFFLSIFVCFNYQLTALYYYYYYSYQLESFGSSFWIILFMFLNHSNTLHTLNLHFPSFLNTFSILIQILQRFNHSTSLQFHPSIHPSIFQTKHRNHFSLSFSQQLPNRSGSWKRGNIATHGAPGVIDEVGADERAGHVVGEEEAEAEAEAEAEGLGDGDHGGVLRPVGQEEIQRARSTLHTFVGSHGPHPIAHQIPAHSHPHPHPHPERTGERGGWLAVHHQHPTNSDVAIVDTPNCLPIHSALPTSLGTHSSV